MRVEKGKEEKDGGWEEKRCPPKGAGSACSDFSDRTHASSIPQPRPSSSEPLTMNIPRELLDTILSNFPPDDQSSFPTLRSCSLVSKSWLEPSRRLLFANVSITPKNYPRWLENIPPTNTGVLRHVRSLMFSSPRHELPAPRIGVPREYLPSLPQLRALSFHNVGIEHIVPEHIDSFSVFQHTLSSLSISHLSFTWSAFVTIIGYFPNLMALEVIQKCFV